MNVINRRLSTKIVSALVLFSALFLVSTLSGSSGSYAAFVKDDVNGTYTDDFSDTTGMLTQSGAGVNTGTGKVQLRNASNGYTAPFNSTGYVILKDIRPLRVAKWGTVSITGTFPEGTTVKLQALDDGGTPHSDIYLPGNSTGIENFPVDVSGISPFAFADGDLCNKVPVLRFKLILSTTDTNITPEIDSFSFNWVLTQGDLSTSLYDDESPWTSLYGDQKNTQRSRYANELIYPAFRWAGEKHYGVWYNPKTFVLQDRLFAYDGWWDGQMYTVNRDTGAIMDEYPYSVGRTGVISKNGTLFTNDIGNDLFTVLDTETATPKWSYNFYGGHSNSSVSIGKDGTLFTFYWPIPGRDVTLYAFNQNGIIAWTKVYTLGDVGDAEASVLPSVIGDDGTLYFTYTTRDSGYAATPNSEVVAVDPDNGDVLWSFPTGYSGWKLIMGDDGTLYSYNYDYSSTYDIKLWAINPNGTLKWMHNFGSGGRGVLDLFLKANGNIFVNYYTSTYDYVIYELDKTDGDVVWIGNNDYLIKLTDDNSAFYYSEYEGVDDNNGLYRIGYVDGLYQDRWQLTYPFPFTEGGYNLWYSLGPPRLDERGWIYSSLSKSVEDDEYNSIHAEEYVQMFALAPWSLTVDAASSARPGNVLTFTATSSMQQNNPLLGGENKVQLVMENGDTVPLSFQWLNLSKDSVWEGTYTVPDTLSEGEYSYAIEASQPYITTDVQTTFDDPPEGSQNTGITLAGTLAVDVSPPTVEGDSIWFEYLSGGTSIIHAKVSDAYSSITSVRVQVDGTDGDWVECTANDGAFDEKQEDISCTVSEDLSGKAHDLYFVLTDSLGNETGVDGLLPLTGADIRIFVVIGIVLLGVGIISFSERNLLYHLRQYRKPYQRCR